MKCIHCGEDSNFKDRSAKQACPKCGRKLAFEPTTDPLKVTDVFFDKAIKLVSSDKTLYFTERQLWYEFARRLAARPWWQVALKAAGIVAVIAGILSAMVQAIWPFALAAPVVLAISAAAFLDQRRRQRQPAIPFENFSQAYLTKWIRAHGEIRLLPESGPRFAQPAGTEPDLTAYSFDRAIVTAHAPIAAMLVANNFHFEHNCAVLSVDGYPAGRADTILSMLRRNPALTVYALHDASPAGCQLPFTLRRPEWFPDQATVIFDLGLRPRHVTPKRWMMLQSYQAALTDEVRKLLTAREVAWLEAGHSVELAALRPAELMRATYRSIARSPQGADKKGEGDSGGGIWIHTGGDGGSAGKGNVAEGEVATGDFDDGGSDGGDIGGADSFG